MNLSGGTLWQGGPRKWLLRRSLTVAMQGSGSPSSHQSYQAFTGGLRSRVPCSAGQRPTQQRTRRSRQVSNVLDHECSPADWKHRRRKPASSCKALINATGHACQSKARFTYSSSHHHAFHLIQHQLDRRRQMAVCSTDDQCNAVSSSDHPASVPTWSDAATPDLPDHPSPVRFAIDRDLEAEDDDKEPQPTEAGILPESRLPSGQSKPIRTSRSVQSSAAPKLIREVASAASSVSTQYAGNAGLVYSPAQRNQIKESWSSLMRWSRVLRDRTENGTCVLERIDKVVVFGGGSFGTAMAAVLARQKSRLQVVLLLRDPYTCHAINHEHTNSRYLEVKHCHAVHKKLYLTPLHLSCTIWCLFTLPQRRALWLGIPKAAFHNHSHQNVMASFALVSQCKSQPSSSDLPGEVGRGATRISPCIVSQC